MWCLRCTTGQLDTRDVFARLTVVVDGVADTEENENGSEEGSAAG